MCAAIDGDIKAAKRAVDPATGHGRRGSDIDRTSLHNDNLLMMELTELQRHNLYCSVADMCQCPS